MLSKSPGYPSLLDPLHPLNFTPMFILMLGIVHNIVIRSSQNSEQGWLLMGKVAEEGADWTEAVVRESTRPHYKQLDGENRGGRRAWHLLAYRFETYSGRHPQPVIPRRAPEVVAMINHSLI